MGDAMTPGAKVSPKSKSPITIAVNRRTLDVTVGKIAPAGSIGISSDLDITLRKTSNPLAALVYFRVLYPLEEADALEKTGLEHHFLLAPPEPWMLAIAHVAWQSLIEGLPWDLVKLACVKALKKLRMSSVAPPARGTTSMRKTRSRSFLYERYSRRGHFTKFLLQTRNTFEEMPKEQRRRVLQPKMARKGLEELIGDHDDIDANRYAAAIVERTKGDTRADQRAKVRPVARRRAGRPPGSRR
jgi:hypothetical protein